MALPDVRRVVTAYDTNGISVFDTDQAIGKVAPPAGSSATQFSSLWGTTEFPSTHGLKGGRDGAESLGKPIVNPGGSTFRIVDKPAGAGSPFHRTESIDYIIVMSGEITLELENGHKTILKAGDVAIQQGTLHKWYNHGTETCRFACIALAAKPMEIDGVTLAGPTFP